MINKRYTHRSGIEQYRRCPRAYYLGQHYDGVGLEGSKRPFEMLTGIYVHEGIGGLLNGGDIDTVITTVLANFHDEVEPEDVLCYGCLPEQVRVEQDSLIEGLIRAWYVKRYPYFSSTYEVIEVEEDHSTPLLVGGIDEVDFEFRLDALLKHKETGLYYILSNKTTGAMDQRKTNDAFTDMQGLSESWGIEQVLKGVKIHGIIMEYLLTGKKKIEESEDGDKVWTQFTPLIRGWYNANSKLNNKYAWRWEWNDIDGGHRLPKGWNRVHATEVEGGVEAWIDSLSKGEMFPDVIGYEDPLSDVFISAEYYRDPIKMNNWLESVKYQEQQVSKALDEIDHEPVLFDLTLNQRFPQYTHSGNYPVKCQFYSICHESASSDPYMSGFRERTPHHEKQRLQFSPGEGGGEDV